jgi:hypothetical protein
MSDALVCDTLSSERNIKSFWGRLNQKGVHTSHCRSVGQLMRGGEIQRKDVSLGAFVRVPPVQALGHDGIQSHIHILEGFLNRVSRPDIMGRILTSSGI